MWNESNVQSASLSKAVLREKSIQGSSASLPACGSAVSESVFRPVAAEQRTHPRSGCTTLMESVPMVLLLARKAMSNLDSRLKSRDFTLPTKFCLVKAMVFPVVMYGCESWTINKAECRRIDAFELWYWRRLLRVPWTARRSNQSIPKEINPGCSLEGLMLKLKLQYFGHLMRRADSLEKTLSLFQIINEDVK